jgi:hypothetical protein
MEEKHGFYVIQVELLLFLSNLVKLTNFMEEPF